MQRKNSNGLQWLEFDLLSDIPHLKHAIFLRQGGASEEHYASLNTGLHVGDKEERVLANIEKIKMQLQSEIPSWKQLVSGRANHGKSIAVVDANSQEELIEIDGLMTATPGISLMMKHADCQIAFFYDPKKNVVANIHSGWRGSVANIYGETIKKMRGVFGSNPCDLLVCISPSLGPDEAEFINYKSELPEEFWAFQVRPAYFDFWSISEHQLQSAGILPHHIEVARLSTYANPYDFFSHRRDKITGRNGACITLLT